MSNDQLLFAALQAIRFQLKKYVITVFINKLIISLSFNNNNYYCGT